MNNFLYVDADILIALSAADLALDPSGNKTPNLDSLLALGSTVRITTTVQAEAKYGDGLLFP